MDSIHWSADIRLGYILRRSRLVEWLIHFGIILSRTTEKYGNYLWIYLFIYLDKLPNIKKRWTLTFAYCSCLGQSHFMQSVCNGGLSQTQITSLYNIILLSLPGQDHALLKNLTLAFNHSDFFQLENWNYFCLLPVQHCKHTCGK